MMLDFPELLAPAKMVSGRISIVCSLARDLYPAALMEVMPAMFSSVYCSRLYFFRTSLSRSCDSAKTL